MQDREFDLGVVLQEVAASGKSSKRQRSLKEKYLEAWNQSKRSKVRPLSRGSRLLRLDPTEGVVSYSSLMNGVLSPVVYRPCFLMASGECEPSEPAGPSHRRTGVSHADAGTRTARPIHGQDVTDRVRAYSTRPPNLCIERATANRVEQDRFGWPVWVLDGDVRRPRTPCSRPPTPRSPSGSIEHVPVQGLPALRGQDGGSRSRPAVAVCWLHTMEIRLVGGSRRLHAGTNERLQPSLESGAWRP